MTKLFVGNLSFEVTQADLRAAFATYGPGELRGHRGGRVGWQIEGLRLH